MVATVLQPIVEGTKKAIDQLDSVIKTGDTGVAEEKQAIDCVLITKDNADDVNNFVLLRVRAARRSQAAPDMRLRHRTLRSSWPVCPHPIAQRISLMTYVYNDPAEFKDDVLRGLRRAPTPDYVAARRGRVGIRPGGRAAGGQGQPGDRRRLGPLPVLQRRARHRVRRRRRAR